LEASCPQNGECGSSETSAVVGDLDQLSDLCEDGLGAILLYSEPLLFPWRGSVAAENKQLCLEQIGALVLAIQAHL